MLHDDFLGLDVGGGVVGFDVYMNTKPCVAFMVGGRNGLLVVGVNWSEGRRWAWVSVVYLLQ